MAGSPPGPAARILVAEDEAIVALEVAELLREIGHEVVAVVASGEDAVARSAELRPDLALLDLHLRGALDGIEVAERLRPLGIPVLFLTAFGDAPTVARAQAAAPVGYLLKPFDGAALAAAVTTGLHRLAAEAGERRAADERRRQERLRFLGALSAGLAHEIRNPLAIILASADALEATAHLTEDDRRFLPNIREAVQRVAGLVGELGALGEQAAEQVVDEDLAALLEASVEPCRRAVAEAGIALVVRAEAGPVRLQRQAVERSVAAVVTNACQAAPRGSDVEVEACRRDGWLEVAVRDRGAGFSAAALARAFDVFFSERTRHLGLGLTIAQSLIQGEGGEVTLANHADGGALVRLRIPLEGPASAPQKRD